MWMGLFHEVFCNSIAHSLLQENVCSRKISATFEWMSEVELYLLASFSPPPFFFLFFLIKVYIYSLKGILLVQWSIMIKKPGVTHIVIQLWSLFYNSEITVYWDPLRLQERMRKELSSPLTCEGNYLAVENILYDVLIHSF